MSPQKIIVTPPQVPPRPADAHKGTFGTVIVVGGSCTMMGAPALCASAALRGGVGLVKIATSAEVLPTALAIEPGATGIILHDDLAASLDLLEQADSDRRAVLAIGPGLGEHESAARLVGALLAGPRPVVLDADGLNLLAATGKPRPVVEQIRSDLVMTPHPGEFKRLADPLRIDHSAVDAEQRPDAAVALARVQRCVVVLKGRRTVVTDAKQLYLNATGNPSLSTAGTGDVLSGLIAALIAQGMGCFGAAVLGVYLHGSAADLWAQCHGPSGLTARDLAAWLPEAFNRHRVGVEKLASEDAQ